MTSKPAPENATLNQRFSYVELDEEARAVVEQHTSAIKTLMHRTAQNIIAVGLKLIEIKEILGHGKFNDWLRTEVELSEWTARKFMEISRKFKSVKFTDLNIAPSALYLIVSKKTPKSAIDEILSKARRGEHITHSTAKAIVTHHTSINNGEVRTHLKGRNVSHSTGKEIVTCNAYDRDGQTKENTKLKSFNAHNLQCPSGFTSGSASFGTTTSPTSSDNKSKLKSRALNQPLQSDNQRLPTAFEPCVSGDEVNLGDEQVEKLPFQVGSAIRVANLEQRSCGWRGEVSEVQVGNDKGVRVTIVINKICHIAP